MAFFTNINFHTAEKVETLYLSIKSSNDSENI